MVSAARSFPSGALQSVPRLQPGGQLGLRLAQWLPACVASVSDASHPVTGDWFKRRLLSWIQHGDGMGGGSGPDHTGGDHSLGTTSPIRQAQVLGPTVWDPSRS